MRYERFRDAFLALVDTSGVSFQDVAERSGLPYDRIYNIKKRPDASTHVETAMAIARSFGMTIEQLMNGDASTPTDLNFVQIPRYRASFSAGGGTQNEAAKMVDFLPFTREFIAGKLGRRSVDGLVIAEVNGESMNPTLSNGDLVMLDTIQRQKPSDRKSTRLNSSHRNTSRMPSSA